MCCFVIYVCSHTRLRFAFASSRAQEELQRRQASILLHFLLAASECGCYPVREIIARIKSILFFLPIAPASQTAVNGRISPHIGRLECRQSFLSRPLPLPTSPSIYASGVVYMLVFSPPHVAPILGLNSAAASAGGAYCTMAKEKKGGVGGWGEACGCLYGCLRDCGVEKHTASEGSADDTAQHKAPHSRSTASKEAE